MTKRVPLQQHKFDAVIKFLTVVVLVVFALALTKTDATLAHDVTLLIAGMVGGKGIEKLS